jgi:flagellar hook protein FlgE
MTLSRNLSIQQKGVLMTISSSLNAGVAGLNANSSRLATISDNIANSSTYGYRRVEASFESMVMAQDGGTYAAGGVRTTTQRLIDQGGSLISTSNPTDLAVSGRGFLPVAEMSQIAAGNNDPEMLLTSTGSFRTDANGRLVTETGQVLLGWPADADGTVNAVSRSTSNGLEPIRINRNALSFEPTKNIELGVNLPATGFGPDGEAVSVEYFDNLGKSQLLSVDFKPTGTENEWQLEFMDSAQASPTDPRGTKVGELVATFDDAQGSGGNLLTVGGTDVADYDAATGLFEVEVGPNLDAMKINIGAENTSDGLTQLSDRFAPISISKDGTPAGSMTSVEVDENGFVQALFDTGVTKTIAQVPLVDVPNPNGMISLDAQTYRPSLDSGPFFLWDAGDGPTGEIAGFARQESATDVAGELTSMIQTQRAYSSNAKVIQTVNEMLQETTNIIR